MTILPKKKKGEQESDSDSDSSSEPAQSPRPHVGASGHGGSPPPSEDTAYHHSPDGIYHRRYDLSSSSGDSSPEHPSISKRPSYRPPSAAAPSTRGKKPLDTSPYYSGYNSSEEYDGSRRPYLDLERERKFEQALKTNRGFVIKKMRPDGACLFRAVADQVYGDQDMHSLVRNHSMDYMLKNADYFSQYVTEDFEQYINRKRADQCYGNNIEMQAVAEMYNRVIEVYEYSTEPSNIFFAVYKTDNAPIRLSYHGGVHYNSVVDPYKATIGVGLGLAGYKPGLADQNLLRKTQRESENFHIEKAMLEDKLRSTDWEATYEAIEEAVARESYLTWLREQEKQTGTSRQGLQSTSAACGGSIYPPLPPPVTTSTALPSTTSLPPPPLPHTTHTTTTTNSTSITITSMQLSNTALNFRSSPLYTTAAEVKAVRSYASSRTSSPATSLRGSRRGTPSPPASFTYRSSSGSGSVRTSPYNSPRDSPRGIHRGSPRNSPHNSAHTSPRNSTHGSPPPSLSLTFGNENDLRTGSHSPTAVTLSPSQLSPPAMRKSLLINNSEANNTVDAGRTSPHTHTTPPHLTMGSTSPTSQQLLSSVVALSPHHHHHSPPPPPGSPPHHSLDFESGRVLGQLPYEYSSFLDLPPAALGLSEWEDDRVLAAALAASQQEYIDSLKKNARGAEAL